MTEQERDAGIEAILADPLHTILTALDFFEDDVREIAKIEGWPADVRDARLDGIGRARIFVEAFQAATDDEGLD